MISGAGISRPNIKKKNNMKFVVKLHLIVSYTRFKYPTDPDVSKKKVGSSEVLTVANKNVEYRPCF